MAGKNYQVNIGYVSDELRVGQEKRVPYRVRQPSPGEVIVDTMVFIARPDVSRTFIVRDHSTDNNGNKNHQGLLLAYRSRGGQEHWTAISPSSGHNDRFITTVHIDPDANKLSAEVTRFFDYGLADNDFQDAIEINLPPYPLEFSFIPVPTWTRDWSTELEPAGFIMLERVGLNTPGGNHLDAGSSSPDAGLSSPDAGSSFPDAGLSSPDAGDSGPCPAPSEFRAPHFCVFYL